MSYRLVDSGSDIVIASEGEDLGEALVGLARGFTHVTTMGSPVRDDAAERIHVETDRDLPALAVAFVNELVFLFGTHGFLPAGGTLTVTSEGGLRVEGRLVGDRYDPTRHQLGTEVKAATYHDAVFEERDHKAQARVLVDL